MGNVTTTPTLKSVWKFPLHVTGEPQSVMMPNGSKVLSVQLQAEQICVWALVNPQEPTEERLFFIMGTGHPFGDTGDLLHFVGTIQMGPLVWHVFELRPKLDG